ncbi:hypothetical protein EYF80_023053 [Liparis tanakae]|uniref:Uncharacterized protein n=1 Tax=Liparis tanakae TaxID=230148 RepID=A0A4Z2HNV9_9TELE|nr:hypothetical protein EYF80_023053 [Liparis tanakae]
MQLNPEENAVHKMMFVRLLRATLRLNLQKRLTASDAPRHPFITLTESVTADEASTAAPVTKSEECAVCRPRDSTDAHAGSDGVSATGSTNRRAKKEPSSLPVWRYHPDSDACDEDALHQSSGGLGERATVQTRFPEQSYEASEPSFQEQHRAVKQIQLVARLLNYSVFVCLDQKHQQQTAQAIRGSGESIYSSIDCWKEIQLWVIRHLGMTHLTVCNVGEIICLPSFASFSLCYTSLGSFPPYVLLYSFKMCVCDNPLMKIR